MFFTFIKNRTKMYEGLIKMGLMLLVSKALNVVRGTNTKSKRAIFQNLSITVSYLHKQVTII